MNQKNITKIDKRRSKKDSKVKIVEKTIFTLHWNRNKKALDAEKNTDGVYPLLSTDTQMSTKAVLTAYKFQPRLEKRFTQFKSIHNAAPLLFKKIERIEANMFLFFIALMIQALIEREVRTNMKEQQIYSLKVYPENRDAIHPTTSKVFDTFKPISTYSVVSNEDVIENYRDDLNPVQHLILELLNIDEAQYWQDERVSKIIE